MSRLVLFEHEVIVFVTVVIILIVLFFPVTIIIAAGSGLADVGMSAHGVCAGSKIVHAMDAHKDQVVMHSPPVVYHHPFILPLLATPGAEQQATSSLQGLWGMNPLQAYDFQQLHGCDYSKEVNVTRGGHGNLVGGPELFLSCPGLLYLMHLSAQEVSGVGHLSEHGG